MVSLSLSHFHFDIISNFSAFCDSTFMITLLSRQLKTPGSDNVAIYFSHKTLNPLLFLNKKSYTKYKNNIDKCVK